MPQNGILFKFVHNLDIVLTLLFSEPIYNMEGKSSTENALIRRFLRCLPIDDVRLRLFWL